MRSANPGQLPAIGCQLKIRGQDSLATGELPAGAIKNRSLVRRGRFVMTRSEERASDFTDS